MSFKNPAKFNPKARVMSFTVSTLLPYTDAASANFYTSTFWTAPAKCVVDSVTARYNTASSSGTVTVHKVPSGTAPDSGTALLASTISTAATADTRYSGTLATTASTLELAEGDGLQLVDSGTLTSLADLEVTVGLHWIS
jgi:hypothetical protein